MRIHRNSRLEAARPSHNQYFTALAIVGLLSWVCASASNAQMQSPQPFPATSTRRMDPPVMDDQLFAHVLLDQFEDRTNGPDNKFRWDGEAWIGTDMNKLWLKSEGLSYNATVSDGDHEALYDHPIPHTRYLDAQLGVRTDLDSGPNRTWAAVGIEGLAPYYFQFSPTLYIRDGGNIAGRLTGSYDLLLTQRWIVQPQAEFNFYNKDDPSRRIGSGLSDVDTGVRLRYEISRKFAPYIGFSYNGKYASTASYARQAGDTSSESRFIFGLRLWY